MTAVTTTAAADTTGISALRDLRARRKRNRLGELEWFEAAYRVYVAGLFGGGALLWLSDIVGDAPVSAEHASDVVRHGPRRSASSPRSRSAPACAAAPRAGRSRSKPLTWST
jgi:hypothetical protein